MSEMISSSNLPLYGSIFKTITSANLDLPFQPFGNWAIPLEIAQFFGRFYDGALPKSAFRIHSGTYPALYSFAPAGM